MHKWVCREIVHITCLYIASKNMWWGGVDTNVQTIMFQMYIIACRAHFCHLLGLGQVGHSPRGTSGSAGTLDWGPMWLGSQSSCHPNAPLHLLAAPYTPRRPPMFPHATLTPSGLWVPTLPASPNTPLTSLHPLMAPMPLNPPGDPNVHSCHLYPFWSLST